MNICKQATANVFTKLEIFFGFKTETNQTLCDTRITYSEINNHDNCQTVRCKNTIAPDIFKNSGILTCSN